TSDQDATATATDHAAGYATATVTELPAPRRRIVGAPGSPWPVGCLVPFQVRVRPTPHRGAILPPPAAPAAPAEPTTATTPVAPVVPVADRSRPSGRPGRGGSDHEQAIAYIRDF